MKLALILLASLLLTQLAWANENDFRDATWCSSQLGKSKSVLKVEGYFRFAMDQRGYEVSDEWISNQGQLIKQELLADPYFLQHPREYFQDLRKYLRNYRGNQSVSIFPHDKIDEFLSYLNSKGELESFAAEAVDEGVVVPNKVRFISQEFKDLK